jgi:hypothetical protein
MKFRFSSKAIIIELLLLSCAAVFLFSGISKLLYINKLEWSIVEFLNCNYTFASIIARIVIGLELILGCLLLAHQYLKFTLLTSQSLIILFSIYLLIEIFNYGNKGDCGCFGNAFSLSPLASLGKNFVMLLFLYWIKKSNNLNWSNALASLALCMLCLAAPFISNPLHHTLKQRPINLAPLSTRMAPYFIDSIKKEKRIIAFLSLGCPHCRIAAKLFHQLQKTEKNAAFLLILNGPDELRNDFFNETKANNVPYLFYNNDPSGFQAMAGPYVPSIYWIENGLIKRETNYLELDEKSINKWFYKNN